jgi:peptidoglycan/LPS O-acetylase OafA/YrhL
MTTQIGEIGPQPLGNDLPPPTQPTGHIPALDGLRGLAILLVLLYHFTPRGYGHTLFGSAVRLIANVGWCGVDLFFVLSGFLITGILLDAKGSPYYLRNFYARRILRIFPLYFGVLAIVFLLIPLFHPFTTPQELHLYHNQPWLWLYAANIKASLAGDWTLNTHWVFLDHFWSLSVEEHFYLVWPFIVLLASRRTLIRICLAFIALALCLRITLFLIGDLGLAIYTFTPARIDELVVGGLIAIWARRPGGITRLVKPAKITLGIFGIALICAWLRVRPEDPIFMTVGFTLLAIFFASLLILTAVSSPAHPLAFVFHTPALRFLGKYSYGIYVFHNLLLPTISSFVFFDSSGQYTGLSFSRVAINMILATLAAIAAAYLSWHLYEKHFLKLKRFFEYQSPTPPSERPHPLTTNH